MRVAVLALVLSAAFALVAPARADSITLSETTITDATIHDVLPSTSFVAESRRGRTGLTGDWELGVGLPDTNPPDANGQFLWNDADHAFTLAYDGTTDTLSYTVGGTSVATTGILFGGEILLRLRGTNGTSASVTIDEVNGSSITAQTFATNGDVVYVLIDGLDLSDSWSLGGSQNLTFGSLGAGSDPALQFKGGSVVPEPGSITLLGAGLAAGLVARRRRRRRRAA